MARLRFEIQCRAAALLGDDRRPEAIEQIARDILADLPEADPMRRILAAFLGLGEGDQFDAELLEQMTPELVFRLDMMASELLELEQISERMRGSHAAS